MQGPLVYRSQSEQTIEKLVNELQVFSRYFFLHNFVGFPDSRNMEDCATAVGISTASANPKTCRAVDAQVEGPCNGFCRHDSIWTRG